MSKPDLSALSIQDLTTELRSRGCAVAVFTSNDEPEMDDLDWNDAYPDGFAGFLADHAKHIEDRMVDAGQDALETLVLANA